MPRIDFYILQAEQNKDEFICKLIEKAYKKRHRIYINAEDQEMAHHFDELLWTYKDDSFLPHNLYGDGPNQAPPIQIGFKIEPNARDILINLSSEIPSFYKNFSRVIEIVDKEPATQKISRTHYKTYKSLGHEITTHKLQPTLQDA